MERLQGICQRILEMAAAGERVIVAIDGRCASGKTTWAKELEQRLACTVFHMDDFFLRPEQRTAERIREYGGNVDYERFLHEVLLPLRKGEPFCYRPYDCHLQQMRKPITVLPKGIAIVEGAYACHPTLWDYYDLRIFLTVPPEEQIRRIRIRNGAQAETFFKQWIPLEEAYFSHLQIAERCDIRIDN